MSEAPRAEVGGIDLCNDCPKRGMMVSEVQAKLIHGKIGRYSSGFIITTIDKDGVKGPVTEHAAVYGLERWPDKARSMQTILEKVRDRAEKCSGEYNGDCRALCYSALNAIQDSVTKPHRSPEQTGEILQEAIEATDSDPGAVATD